MTVSRTVSTEPLVNVKPQPPAPTLPASAGFYSDTNPSGRSQVDGRTATPTKLRTLWGQDMGLAILGIRARLLLPQVPPSTSYRAPA